MHSRRSGIIRPVVFSTVLFISLKVFAQPAFQIIPLGVRGGGDESNLSSYLVAPISSDKYLCLDAGTIRAGIEKAIDSKALPGRFPDILKNSIKGYLISHGHLDHVAGLIINSPDDSTKTIYGFPYVIDVFKEKYFSWKSWANFGDQGELPVLKKYHYEQLDTVNEIAVAGTTIHLRSFILSHGHPYQSSAFLLRQGNDFLLYLGDTGADVIEHGNRLQELWKAIAPLIKERRLKGIFIECSFPNNQPDKQLFGHLTPRLLLAEMGRLNEICGGGLAIDGLPVIVTHMKPMGDNEKTIREELIDGNSLKLKLIFPKQGQKILL